MSAADSPQLSVVLPVFNEAAGVRDYLTELIQVLRRIGVPSEMILVDDASTDGTTEILQEMRDTTIACVVIRHKENRGHGAALRTGYLAARGNWIAHLDGDGEVAAQYLSELWSARSDGLVLGVRADRHRPLFRRWISRLVALPLSRRTGQRLADVNSPCRIFPATELRQWLTALPSQSAVPNVHLTFLAARSKRIVMIPIGATHRTRPFSLARTRRLLMAGIALLVELVAPEVRRFGRDSANLSL